MADRPWSDPSNPLELIQPGDLGLMSRGAASNPKFDLDKLLAVYLTQTLEVGFKNTVIVHDAATGNWTPDFSLGNMARIDGTGAVAVQLPVAHTGDAMMDVRVSSGAALTFPGWDVFNPSAEGTGLRYLTLRSYALGELEVVWAGSHE